VTNVIPLQQAASGSRVYACDLTWRTVGCYVKFGFTSRDDLSVREENLAREYGEADMILSWPGTETTERWLHHQFHHERLGREQSGKTSGWHPTELYFCSDGIAAWMHATIDLSEEDPGIRIECGSRELAHKIVTAIYRERWNQAQWEDEAA
jgi:hypothetical protein